MIGNDIRIKEVTDLYQIFEESIYLSGKMTQDDMYKELYANSWGIIIDYELAKKITSDELAEFISDLIKFRSQEILMIKPISKATLYFWFDHQALQLCFNILSGKNRDLPFGCKVNFVDYPYPILNLFLKVAYNNALHGNYLGITEIIENDNQKFIENDDYEVNLENFIIDVWKTTLPFDSKTT